MPVKIRLQRRGSKKRPFYAVVAADSAMPRDGRSLEKLGTYDPRSQTEPVRLNVERVGHWLGVGAVPTERVAKFIKAQGIQPIRPQPAG